MGGAKFSLPRLRIIKGSDNSRVPIIHATPATHLWYNHLYINHSLYSYYRQVHEVTSRGLNKNADHIFRVVILVMLDLSAEFDTFDHDILFSRLENALGIMGQALAWLKSYLSGRTLRITIDKSFSELKNILLSVLQGSVLGPLLFLIYLLPLQKLVRKHG